MTCHSDSALSDFVAGHSVDPGLGEHIAKCAECQRRIAEFAVGSVALALSADEVDATELGPGSIIADAYQLIRLLGEGGQSDVFEAVALRDETTVALKIFKPREHERIAGVDRELNAAKRLTHPRLVRVLEALEVEGRSVLVTELVRGRPLSTLVRERLLSMSRVRRITEQILEGVRAIHAASVLHRDLKPANVMVRDDDEIVLIDFGLASDTEIRSQTTRSALVGTPVYWAPELVSGHRSSVASDLYACGRIALEMFDAVAPRDRDARFRRVIEKSLHPFPDARFSSADAMLDALRSLESRQHRWVIAGSALALAIGLAALALPSTLRRGAITRIDDAHRSSSTPAEGRDSNAPATQEDPAASMRAPDAPRIMVASTPPDAGRPGALRRERMRPRPATTDAPQEPAAATAMSARTQPAHYWFIE